MTKSYKYAVGWNLPGCLPEAEPVKATTFSGAKVALIYELLTVADEEESDDHALAAEDVTLWSMPDVIQVGLYNYWIQEIHE